MQPSSSHPLFINGAMEAEISLLRNNLQQSRPHCLAGYFFWEGLLYGQPVVLGQTGIGMVHAAASTALAIQTFSPCAVINQGTAGGHSLLVHRGDLILSTSCVNITSFESLPHTRGEGCHPEKWKHCTFEEMDGPPASPVTGDPTLLRLAENCPYEYGRIFQGVLGSGDVWNREADRILWLNTQLHTMCEDMESFSVGQVAHHAHIPFLGVRIISNHEIHMEEFDRNTAEKCQEFIQSLIQSFPDYKRAEASSSLS